MVDNVTSKLVLAFVTLLISVALIGTIASEGLVKTSKTAITSETQSVGSTLAQGWNGTDLNTTKVYTLAQAPTGWKATDCPITNFILSNGTDEFTETTDYVLSESAGTYTLVNSATAKALIPSTNLTYASYSYCGDDYLNIGWGRTLVNMLGGFFALAILMVSLALFYGVAKDTGIV